MQLQVVHNVLPEPLQALEQANDRLGGSQHCQEQGYVQQQQQQPLQQQQQQRPGWHACSTAEAMARMTASRPTAASATAPTLGGILTSSRRGSTMSPGRSTVSSFVRNACARTPFKP